MKVKILGSLYEVNMVDRTVDFLEIDFDKKVLTVFKGSTDVETRTFLVASVSAAFIHEAELLDVDNKLSYIAYLTVVVPGVVLVVEDIMDLLIRNREVGVIRHVS